MTKFNFKIKIIVEEIIEALKELRDKDYQAELAAAKKEILEGKGKKAEEVFKKLGI
ncbi:MAG: hypothetical protein ACPLXP_03265 [Microgenomates group bacterium]